MAVKLQNEKNNTNDDNYIDASDNLVPTTGYILNTTKILIISKILSNIFSFITNTSTIVYHSPIKM